MLIVSPSYKGRIGATNNKLNKGKTHIVDTDNPDYTLCKKEHSHSETLGLSREGDLVEVNCHLCIKKYNRG